MSEARKAGCACGAVQVNIEGDPAVQAFCHCDTCRSWLGAPIHAATLWPTDNVTVTQGEGNLAVYERTPASLRHFCTACGSPVLIRHPVIGMTDVPAGNIEGFEFEASIHVNYSETVLRMRDGLPKFAGMPTGSDSDEMLPE